MTELCYVVSVPFNDEPYQCSTQMSALKGMRWPEIKPRSTAWKAAPHPRGWRGKIPCITVLFIAILVHMSQNNFMKSLSMNAYTRKVFRRISPPRAVWTDGKEHNVSRNSLHFHQCPWFYKDSVSHFWRSNAALINFATHFFVCFPPSNTAE